MCVSVCVSVCVCVCVCMFINTFFLFHVEKQIYTNNSSSLNLSLCPASTVVEQMTYNCKMEGSNPSPGNGRETENAEKVVGLRETD